MRVPSAFAVKSPTRESVGPSLRPLAFVQTLKEVNRDAPTRPRYCNVKSEFKKIIEAFDEEQAFEFFDNEERARNSFDN